MIRRDFPFLLLLCALGCFSSTVPLRRYYVLQAATSARRFVTPPISGLVRVRALDAESAYDKFQIVVRSSPYELAYREGHVWAVKPNRMISDQIAAQLTERHLFSAVSRELGERRPDYILAGDLHAIEIYDSRDMWFAHLSLSLNLTDFATGEARWHYSFDQRKAISSKTFSHAVRTMSELLSQAIDGVAGTLGEPHLSAPDGAPASLSIEAPKKQKPISPQKPRKAALPASDAPQPLFVPVPGRAPSPGRSHGHDVTN